MRMLLPVGTSRLLHCACSVLKHSFLLHTSMQSTGIANTTRRSAHVRPIFAGKLPSAYPCVLHCPSSVLLTLVANATLTCNSMSHQQEGDSDRMPSRRKLHQVSNFTFEFRACHTCTLGLVLAVTHHSHVTLQARQAMLMEKVHDAALQTKVDTGLYGLPTSTPPNGLLMQRNAV